MSTPTVLPPAALDHLVPATAPGGATGPALGLVLPALRRAGRYLLPVPPAIAVAVAATEPLQQVPWPVPVGAVVLGWSVVPGLRWAAPRVPARVVLAGFGALAAMWAVLLALAPAHLVGADRTLAYAVSLGGLALLAVVAIGTARGDRRAGQRAHWRTGQRAHWRTGRRAVPHPHRRTRLITYSSYGPYPVLVRRAGAYLLLGLAQGAVVVMVWRSGQAAVPTDGPPPALLPLLVAVPLIELCASWHLARLAGGLAHHDRRDRYLRYARRLGWTTLVALLPPLVAGAALAGTASRLPYRLSEHPDAPGLVLAMAGGVLLAGVLAIGWVLAARGRPLLAALVTAAPVPAALAWHASVPGLAATSLSGWGQLLPATVIALAVVYAAGLVLAAQVLFDSRSHR